MRQNGATVRRTSRLTERILRLTEKVLRLTEKVLRLTEKVLRLTEKVLRLTEKVLRLTEMVSRHTVRDFFLSVTEIHHTAHLTEACSEALWVGLSLWVGTSDLPNTQTAACGEQRDIPVPAKARPGSESRWVGGDTYITLSTLMRIDIRKSPTGDRRLIPGASDRDRQNFSLAE